MAAVFYLMHKPYLIQSKPDDQGRFWAVAKETEMNYLVGWLPAGSDVPINVTPHFGLGAALSRIKDMAAYDKLEVDWSSLRIVVGELIVVETETKDGARSRVRVFHSQAAYDNFRRKQLELYSEHNEDASEVAGLLESGNLDLAWDTACEDDGEKALWDTDFGSHSVERLQNVIAFTDLPAWYQNTIKDTL